MYMLSQSQQPSSPVEGKTHYERLTVYSDSDLWVVVFVRNLPDVKRFGWCVGQEAEEKDDGVRWGKTLRMDLPVRVKNIHVLERSELSPYYATY